MCHVFVLSAVSPYITSSWLSQPYPSDSRSHTIFPSPTRPLPANLLPARARPPLARRPAPSGLEKRALGHDSRMVGIPVWWSSRRHDRNARRSSRLRARAMSELGGWRRRSSVQGAVSASGTNAGTVPERSGGWVRRVRVRRDCRCMLTET
ncbi:hypothetical protein PLICRDRAFT_549022 [Plicaturopsis crispa FD-325 SS-3]|nr:hypothetical protein PLICRDRAFT_549022 [Plicaturopsis crispa FD-325 SS-3]